jgi:hypothetical protein
MAFNLIWINLKNQIYITLGYGLATGDVNLYEIVYGLKEIRDQKNINRGFKKLGVWEDAISLKERRLLQFNDF